MGSPKVGVLADALLRSASILRMQSPARRLTLRLAGAILWLTAFFAPLGAQGQNERPFALPAPPEGTVQPSNPQLASPAIESRVDALLEQMTLEEKLGQLVQYGAPDDSANAGLANDNNAPGNNPQAHIKIDPMDLAAKGLLGSMLNVVGAKRTNAFQRAAVEKSRLHIPILFGADILHGYRTVAPIPLGLAATFDPDLVESVSRLSAVRWCSIGPPNTSMPSSRHGFLAPRAA